MLRLPLDELGDTDPEAEAIAQAMLLELPEEFGHCPDGDSPDEVARRVLDAVEAGFPPNYGHAGEDVPMPSRGFAFVQSWPAQFLAGQVAAGVDVRPWFLTADLGPRWWSVHDFGSKFVRLVGDALVGCSGMWSAGVVLPDEQLPRWLPLGNQGRGLVHRASALLFSAVDLDESAVARAWGELKGSLLVLRPMPVDGGVDPWRPADGVERARGGLALAVGRVLGAGFNVPGNRVRVFPFSAPHARVSFFGDLREPLVSASAVSLAEQL